MYSLLCPYPGCAVAGGLNKDGEDCSCTWKRPIRKCTCGIINRGDARHCRGCRRELRSLRIESADPLRPGPVVLTSIRGVFRQPPVAQGPWLYAHTLGGSVVQFSAQAGAQSCEMGRLTVAGAGYNRAALVRVQPRKGHAWAGDMYVVTGPDSVEGVSLATGESHTLYEAGTGERIAAVENEAGSTGMRGVARWQGLVAVAVHAAKDVVTLMALAPGEDRPADMLMTLSGSRVAGPAVCGGRLALCTDQQVGCCDATRGAVVQDFPRGFSPMLERGDNELSIAPGSLPLFLEEAGGSDRVVWVAGWRSSRSGLLRMNLDRGDSFFRELHEGSSLATHVDGGACLCSNDAVEIYGGEPTWKFPANLQSWMPAFYQAPLLTWFEYQPYPERRRLSMRYGEQQLELTFESPDFSPQNCCGAFLVGRDLALCSLPTDIGGGQAGLNLAVSSLQ